MIDIERILAENKPTWDELVELEPRLEALLTEVRAAKPPNPYDEYYNWEGDWAQFKSPINKLVGWHRTGCCHIMLKTGAAYRVVYFKLLHEFLGEVED